MPDPSDTPNLVSETEQPKDSEPMEKQKYPDHYPVYGHSTRIFNLRLAAASFIQASEDYHASPADGPIAKRYAERKRLLLQEIGLDNEPYQDGRPPYVMPGSSIANAKDVATNPAPSKSA
jgi:hypothetical protein